MTRKKKWILIVAVCALVVGVCSFVGIRHYQKNQITFTVNDILPEGNGQKATVILLGGQSNASGCSLDEYLKKNVSAEEYAEYQNGFDNVYINYLSGANMSQAFVKCASFQGELPGSFGPELGLAEALSKMYPDRTFFIIKCAWGGSNLYSQWLSPSSWGKTGDLYKQFEAFVQTSIEYLVSKNYDVEIAGMCWMQGESDAFAAKNAEKYATHLNNLIKDVRKEFAQYAAEGGIAFVDAYIAANPAYWVYYEAVNRGKQEIADSSELNVVVDTVTAGLTCENEPEGAPDLAHYDSMSQILLGQLFGKELEKFLG